MINCVLIDDELNALKILELKLKNNCPDCNILAVFQNPEEALQQIEALQPDLVFLDIEMPNKSGFDFLSALDKPVFEVIFVTAYNQYAIEAIKHSAMGYIVKPIDDDELLQAVENAKANIDMKLTAKNNKTLLELLSPQSNSISITTQNGYVFIKKKNIIRLEGTDGYTKIICCDSREYLSSNSLGKFSDLLENPGFFQVHRSHIINLKFVTEYLYDGYVKLVDKSLIPVSKSKRKELIRIMGEI